MKHDRDKLEAILFEASVATVRVECQGPDAARRFRYALARRRGPAGQIVIRLEGRFVIAEPCQGTGIIGMEVT